MESSPDCTAMQKTAGGVVAAGLHPAAGTIVNEERSWSNWPASERRRWRYLFGECIHGSPLNARAATRSTGGEVSTPVAVKQSACLRLQPKTALVEPDPGGRGGSERHKPPSPPLASLP